MKRVFRVYGAEGHRQRESFSPSSEFETWSGSKVQIRNADLTGTNEYSEIVIQAKTNEQIIKTLNGQIDDGTFENSRTGKVTEVINGAEIEMCEKKYKIHEIETNVTYDDLYSSVKEAEKVIEYYKADDEEREVTYEIIEA